MADEDIAALVVDNGSGMCKVSVDSRPPLFSAVVTEASFDSIRIYVKINRKIFYENRH